MGDVGATSSTAAMAAGYTGPFATGPGTVARHLLDESPRLGWTATTALSPFAGSTSRPSRTRSSVVYPLVPYGHQRARPVRSFGLVSSFPPTSCGIATFSAALSAGLIACGPSVDGVRTGAGPELEDPLVVAALGDGQRHNVAAAVAVLNGTEVVIVQHEYGLYDGVDGESITDLLSGIEVPIIIVA